jgi:hypothetical protein
MGIWLVFRNKFSCLQFLTVIRQHLNNSIVTVLKLNRRLKHAHANKNVDKLSTCDRRIQMGQGQARSISPLSNQTTTCVVIGINKSHQIYVTSPPIAKMRALAAQETVCRVKIAQEA